MICMGVDPKAPPEKYYCENCNQRPLANSHKKAQGLQKKWLKAQKKAEPIESKDGEKRSKANSYSTDKKTHKQDSLKAKSSQDSRTKASCYKPSEFELNPPPAWLANMCTIQAPPPLQNYADLNENIYSTNLKAFLTKQKNNATVIFVLFFS